jgi:hypothetical protein
MLAVVFFSFWGKNISIAGNCKQISTENFKMEWEIKNVNNTKQIECETLNKHWLIPWAGL